jgi:hypothetical protein
MLDLAAHLRGFIRVKGFVRVKIAARPDIFGPPAGGKGKDKDGAAAGHLRHRSPRTVFFGLIAAGWPGGKPGLPAMRGVMPTGQGPQMRCVARQP